MWTELILNISEWLQKKACISASPRWMNALFITIKSPCQLGELHYRVPHTIQVSPSLALSPALPHKCPTFVYKHLKWNNFTQNYPFYWSTSSYMSRVPETKQKYLQASAVIVLCLDCAGWIFLNSLCPHHGTQTKPFQLLRKSERYGTGFCTLNYSAVLPTVLFIRPWIGEWTHTFFFLITINHNIIFKGTFPNLMNL